MFIVIEIQVDSQSHVATLVTQHENRNAADAAYHMILAAAAVSNVPIHSAVMLTDDGGYVCGQSYRHGEVAAE